MGTRILGYIFIGVALVVATGVLYWNSAKRATPLVFAPTQMLSVLWSDYKTQFLENGTLRTLDKQRNNITTSEGESYTMLRAVWQGDKETFDTSWQWTKDNLMHKDDHLFSWLFGKHSDGSYGVLSEQGGTTTASDADTDIALALVFAYARWQDPAYLTSAKATISDIWDKEVMTIGGTPYLMANNLEKTSPSDWGLMNPSYLNPAAYRIFAEIDTAHPWQSLRDNSYLVLNKSIVSTLNTTKSANLPPDWVLVNKHTGALSAPTKDSGLTTNFGYDALRVPWRLALDYQWFKEPRAKTTLQKLTLLSSQWNTRGMLATTYTHAGDPTTQNESPAMYGGTIGYFVVANPSVAEKVYSDKLVFLFNPDTNTWKNRLSYYDDNLAWFGIGLYNNLLPNIAQGVPLNVTP